MENKPLLASADRDRVEYHFEVPDQADELAARLRKNELVAHAKLLDRSTSEQATLRAVRLRSEQDLVEYFGSDKLKQVRAFSRQQRHLRRPTELDGDVRLDSLRGAREAQAKALLHALDFDSAARRGFSDSFLQEARQIGQVPAQATGSKLYRVGEDQVPKEIRERKTNPWTLRVPPYDGWAWHYKWHLTGDGDYPVLANYLDGVNGSLGQSVQYLDSDAGNYDYFDCGFRTSQGVFFMPSRVGQVELWIELQCLRSDY